MACSGWCAPPILVGSSVRQADAPAIPGFAFQYVYRTDANPQDVYRVVGVKSKEVYQLNGRVSRATSALSALP